MNNPLAVLPHPVQARPLQAGKPWPAVTGQFSGSKSWKIPAFLCPLFGALPEARRPRIWESASRCWSLCTCLRSSSAGAACMTGLTSMRGWTNISIEGGPGRRLYGP